MHLWSDYEGKTVATYPLEHLIRPEGRSAFFLTRNGTESADILRLTESLNDEAEMLGLWRQVSALEAEHLIKIKRFGQASFEGTPLTFALMESSDSSLAEILRERPLTPTETREVANSLVSALLSLHKSELVHEHVEPANVLAVGETVKLRSDCVRACRVDSEFVTEGDCERARQHDVAGLASVLLEALTLEKPVGGAIRPGLHLPGPFDKIVARGLDGSWGLKEIEGALNPPVAKPLVPPSVLQNRSVAAPAAEPAKASFVPEEVFQLTANPQDPPAVAEPSASAKSSASDWASRLSAAAPPVAPRVSSSQGPELPVRRSRMGIETRGRSPRFWLACAVATLLVAMLTWFTVWRRESAAATATDVAAASADASPQPQPAAPQPQPSAQPAPAAAPAVPPGGGYTALADVPEGKATHPPVATAETQPGWHVVAFTYNREDQAMAKVRSIRERHSALSPEVFAPAGRGPYLVGLGGGMTEREADAIKARARHEGMPRDTFIRRFGAR